MRKKKTADDLKKNPMLVNKIDPNTPPVSFVLSNLLTTGGKQLEIMTRSTPEMQKARTTTFFFATQIKTRRGGTGIEYANEMYEQLMRLSCSLNGEGRKEQIACLQAGGQLPDSFYETTSNSQYVQTDE